MCYFTKIFNAVFVCLSVCLSVCPILNFKFYKPEQSDIELFTIKRSRFESRIENSKIHLLITFIRKSQPLPSIIFYAALLITLGDTKTKLCKNKNNIFSSLRPKLFLCPCSRVEGGADIAGSVGPH